MSLNGMPAPGTDGLPIERMDGYPDWVNRVAIRFRSPFIGPCLRGGADAMSTCGIANGRATARSLFCVSRRISKESLEVFYSENKFVVHRCANNGLGAVSRLSNVSLASLTSLRIEVNTTVITHHWRNEHIRQGRGRDGYCQCPCNNIEVESTSEDYRYCTCRKSDAPLQIASRRCQQAIQDLQDLIQTLRRSIKPRQLDLGIICDVRDTNTARLFVSNLEQLPLLRRCSIRFSTSSHSTLREIARSTIAKLTAADAMPNSFRPLPAEIRWKIFEHAGLVAPEDIQWKGKGARPGFNLHLHDFQRRQECSCIHVKGWNHSHSSFAKSCNCWQFPIELFLLNREHNIRAKQIFYSHNHFILLPDQGYTLPSEFAVDYVCHRPPPSYSFLDSALFPAQHLKSLQFVLPMAGAIVMNGQRGQSFAIEVDSLPQCWTQMIYSILQCQGHGKLNLVFDFCTLDYRPLQLGNWTDGHPAWSARLSKIVYIVRRLTSNYGALRSFFIYLPDEIKHLELDSHYEELIMGQHYEETIRNKYSHVNRHMYWYTFSTGWTIRQAPLEDVVGWTNIGNAH